MVAVQFWLFVGTEVSGTAGIKQREAERGNIQALYYIIAFHFLKINK